VDRAAGGDALAGRFVAIGFGLVVSPIEEDREQLFDEARRMQLDATALKQVGQPDATAQLMRTHFNEGFEALAKVRTQIGAAPWARTSAANTAATCCA
jgi:hypothetical protein